MERHGMDTQEHLQGLVDTLSGKLVEELMQNGGLNLRKYLQMIDISFAKLDAVNSQQTGEDLNKYADRIKPATEMIAFLRRTVESDNPDYAEAVGVIAYLMAESRCLGYSTMLIAEAVA